MGSIADPSFADLNELGPGEYEDVAEQRRQLLGQDISIHMDADDEDGETAELRAMLEARRQSGQTGDLTDITDGEPTFLFRIPERSRLSLAPSVPRAPQDQIVEDEFEDIEPDVLGGAEVDYDDVPSDAGEYELDEAPLREDFVPLPDDDHHHHHQGQAEPAPKKMHKRLTKELKVSRYGIDYPSFPPSVVKRLANTFSRSYGGSGKLNKDTLAAIQQATDWFFEQVSEDLASYADHAGRKTIEEADVVTLMKRYDFPYVIAITTLCLFHMCTGSAC
jgi:histone H3/H4